MLASPNGKCYIGQTIRPIEKRLEEHEVGKSKDCCAIYNAIKSHGWENLEKDWYYCPDEDLNKHEELMIEVLGTLSPNGYNLKEGGGNGKMSEETKQKLRKPKSDEHKQRLIEPKLGEKNPNFGKTGEKHQRSKRVYQYDLNGTFINSFGSTAEAGRHLKKNKSNISKCASGVPSYKTAYGFKWAYVMNYT